MSEPVATRGSWTEQEYEDAKRLAILKTVAFLQIADDMGKDPMLAAAEFMAAFQAEAVEVLGA